MNQNAYVPPGAEWAKRARSLKFAKGRALEYLDAGDKRSAVMSLQSDFDKAGVYERDSMPMMMLMTASMNPAMVDKAFITGFT